MSQILDINPKAKGLIFDLDGTIADTMPIHYIAWRNAASHFGIDFTVELFSELAGIPLYPTVQKLNEMFGKNIDPKEMGDAKEDEYENNMHKIRPITPVVDLIKKYKDQLPMAIGTGGCRRISQKALNIIGVDQYVDILISADDVQNHKPHPETFLRCAELMNIEPELCEVFEDGVLGIQAAETAGMMSVDVTKYYEVTIGKE